MLGRMVVDIDGVHGSAVLGEDGPPAPLTDRGIGPERPPGERSGTNFVPSSEVAELSPEDRTDTSFRSAPGSDRNAQRAPAAPVVLAPDQTEYITIEGIPLPTAGSFLVPILRNVMAGT